MSDRTITRDSTADLDLHQILIHETGDTGHASHTNRSTQLEEMPSLQVYTELLLARPLTQPGVLHGQLRATSAVHAYAGHHGASHAGQFKHSPSPDHATHKPRRRASVEHPPRRESLGEGLGVALVRARIAVRGSLLLWE